MLLFCLATVLLVCLVIVYAVSSVCQSSPGCSVVSLTLFVILISEFGHTSVCQEEMGDLC